MEENVREPETTATKPRKTSVALLIGLIAVAALAFFGVKQIMYYNALKEEKAKASVPVKVLTEAEMKNSQVKEDDN